MDKKAPSTTASGRVSPTAPESTSASANVWRLLETAPGFADGMERAEAEHTAGGLKPFKHKVARPTR